MTGKIVEVAAAILLRESADGDGRIEYLLARRPAGKVYAGYWEFPGGKVEPGENLRQALVRELQEELGITIDRAWPWLSCRFTYPHATVRLKFFRVASWLGEISPIEHDGFVWVKIGSEAPVSPVLPANGPILRALELPAEYARTGATGAGIETELVRLDEAVNRGLRLIQIDHAEMELELSANDRQRFASAAMKLAAAHPEARVLVKDDAALARTVGAHGLHLSSTELLKTGQRPPFDWVAADCHSEADLAHAVALGLDFVTFGLTLSAVNMPADADWAAFAQRIEQSPLPVFAVGEMQREMLEMAWNSGAHGIVQSCARQR